MRNLHLLRNLSSQKSLLLDVKQCYIVNESSISKETQCFVFTKDWKVYSLDLFSQVSEAGELIADLTEYVDESTNVAVAACNYIFGELFTILSDGQLIVVNTEDGDNEVSVKHLNTQVQSASWSPDFERTVIVNNKEVLLVLSIINDDVETLVTIALQSDNEEQNKFVNVGWGKVETQFRGSEGKFSQCKPTETPVDNHRQDNSIGICWKQNSTAFACSYNCRSEGIRKINIYSQDGVLLNITRGILGLYSPIDWCPSRNLITAVQRLPNKQVISFVEENALKHGDFQIPDDVEIIKLYWNNNGTILACHGRRGEGENSNEFISLWTTSNYKWYQKQKIEFNSCDVIYVQWDLSIPNRLHVVLENGVHRMFEWSFEIDQSSSECAESLIAVVNGRNVNFTPYKNVCMPPSMPYATCCAAGEVNAVVFPNAVSGELKESAYTSVLLYLNDNRFQMMKFTEPSKENLISISFTDADSEIDFATPLELSAWLWMVPNFLCFSWSRVDGSYFCVVLLDQSAKCMVVQKMMKLNSPIVTITNYESDVIVHLEDGTLFAYQNNQLYPMKFAFLEPCSRVLAINANTLIGLSEHRNLYINETIKWRDIVSFHWRPPFLVFVTMDSQLLITKVDFVGEEINFSQVQSRSIDPKSFVVTIIDDRVFLEMERGNLEVVRPRPFSIFRMETLLKNEWYSEAFTMLRRQRINLNVLFDHDPALFVKNIQKIVDTVTDPMLLSTFVTELVNENVAKNMFPWKYSDAEETKGKVNAICEELASSIKLSNVAKLVSPLIAALVRQGKLTEAANYAIQYNEIATLCHLADPIAVYEAALASYDLTCALKIVEQSKLDPSEYLPFIHQLQNTEENYRKFMICDYLEKRSEALQHLAECSEEEKFEQCLAYIRKHDLYTDALNVFSCKNKSPQVIQSRHERVLKVIADFYFEKKLYEEAAVLYEKVKMEKEALDCYIQTGDWLAAVSVLMASNVTVPKNEVYDALYSVAQKRGQFEDCAHIAFHYMLDCEKAVEGYLKARKYCNAMDAARALRNEAILVDTIRPHVLAEVDSVRETLAAATESIDTYADRFYRLREKKKNNETYYEGDRSSCLSDDGSSDSGSVSSFGSGVSSASSSAKRLRRRERQLWNLKKGNPREEPSLQDVIKDTIENSEKLLSRLVPELLKTLVRMDDVKLAQEVKAEYSQFLSFLFDTRSKVWPPEDVTDAGGFKDIRIRCPPDVTLTGWESKLLR